MLTWRRTLILVILGLMISGGIAYFQHSPGYMDADYYLAGGLQLATGKGFTEPYLWNYLDNPAGLPHPSHAYWMPLASILAALGMKLTGQNTWLAGRIGFLVIAASIPIVTSTLAYTLLKRRDLAFISGLLAIFSGFYAAFIPVTDTFGIYMLLGGIFFMVAYRQDNWRNFILGVTAGFMHLARADGIVWLLVSFLVILFIPTDGKTQPKLLTNIISLSICVFGYILIMGAWFVRNDLVFGSFLAPGGESQFWLTQYNQLFSYQPESITFNSWLQNGIMEALKVRLWALNMNLQNTIASQASVFLLPLIMIGAWKLRKNPCVIIAFITWIGYIVLMSIIFPFAGARGGFFHSGAALQPMWWALAPVGLVTLVEWVGKKRAWNVAEASRIFLVGSVGLSILLTVIIVIGKLFSPVDGGNIWSYEYNLYREVNTKMINSDNLLNPIVVVANPPGFYLASSKNAIAIPDGDEQATLLVARRYDASYLILEEGGFPDGLIGLYQNPGQYPNFHFLGEVEGARVFRIDP
ncbi:MAG: hypothetical protein A2X25_01930 [Chloroflexi bacterium GWB2_49_20]|nr:MAG: hypothetical protein A2X25_01930 [Chloroflexi bacterium GWB2_49_20]OGN78205.1 MAG: hypothetical protein A2X26_14535 [Chloroflexi bacterium GWC2_49_37]OGN85241.1 MAG: hypothetical protein A2X27_07190 [Chloroflexi bacterium GWD2_49_16]